MVDLVISLLFFQLFAHRLFSLENFLESTLLLQVVYEYIRALSRL